MQATFWLVAVLLAVPQAGALVLEGTASSPSHARGAMTSADLTWAVIIFAPDSEARVHVAAPGVERLTNHSRAWARGPVFNANPAFLPGTDIDLAWDGDLETALVLGRGRWSSLVVEGTGIEVVTEGLATLQVPFDSQTFSPSNNVPRATAQPFAPARESALLRNSAERVGDSFPWSLRAASISRVEWHNATIECHAVSCPDGANTLKQEIDDDFFVQWMSYMEAVVPSGDAFGKGTAYAVAAGGPSLSFVLDGALRLPEVSLDSCTPAPCPGIEDQTLTLQGLAESRVEPAEGRRLRFAMDATPTAAFADESAIPAFIRSGAPALAAAVGIAVLAKLLALFARDSGDPLRQPKRKRLYEEIVAQPGISYRELLRLTGIGNGSALHHIRKLAQAGLVIEQRSDGRRRLFENHGRYSTTWQAVAALRDEPSRLLFDWILQHPEAAQREAVAFGLSQRWSRAATQTRLNRLVASGLVAARRHGRRVTYAATPRRATTGN